MKSYTFWPYTLYRTPAMRKWNHGVPFECSVNWRLMP
jgi:hypothetical protein